MTPNRISTSHAGSLPRTPELIAANAARTFADDGFTLERTPEFEALLTAAVVDLVQRRKNLGITIPGDGEYGKAMSNAVDYGPGGRIVSSALRAWNSPISIPSPQNPFAVNPAISG